MAVGEMKLFPKGAIAMDNGDLMQVINVKFSVDNGAKPVYALRSRKAVGVVLGNEETSVSFEAKVPAEGSERDYLKLCQSGTIKQLRVKVPGETYPFSGVFKKVEFDLPEDDAVKVSIEFIGRLDM